MTKCTCSWCNGIDFEVYCRNCEHGVSTMERHSRGPSWDGICTNCHLAERKALEDRKPIKHFIGNCDGIAFERHNGCTVVLGRDEDG